MKLLHDPANGDLPSVLALVHKNDIVETSLKEGIRGRLTCGRCNRDLSEHVWLLVDENEPEQDGVLDCGGENR